MQELIQELQPQQTYTQIILEILADKYSRKILDSTRYNAKSAVQLSRECEIPISTVYRRIQRLEEGNLLGISGEISEDGKRSFLYKNKVEAIHGFFSQTELKVEVIPTRR